MSNTQKMVSTTTLLPASALAFSCDALRQRRVRGLADASNSETKNAIRIMGNQPIPHHMGPKGTSHTPPAQAKMDTTIKNQRKLSHGPFVPKARETIQTINSPKASATTRSAINKEYSFLFYVIRYTFYLLRFTSYALPLTFYFLRSTFRLRFLKRFFC